IRREDGRGLFQIGTGSRADPGTGHGNVDKAAFLRGFTPFLVWPPTCNVFGVTAISAVFPEPSTGIPMRRESMRASARWDQAWRGERELRDEREDEPETKPQQTQGPAMIHPARSSYAAPVADGTTPNDDSDPDTATNAV